MSSLCANQVAKKEKRRTINSETHAAYNIEKRMLILWLLYQTGCIIHYLNLRKFL